MLSKTDKGKPIEIPFVRLRSFDDPMFSETICSSELFMRYEPVDRLTKLILFNARDTCLSCNAAKAQADRRRG